MKPRGALKLAKSVLWNEFVAQFCIDEESIRDKSKVNVLAKMLVSLQVSWALLKSISRLALGYPISVLEIHTLVYGGCAMVMYGLWWEKPLDIRDSTIIRAEAFQDSSTFQEKLALTLVRSAGSAYNPFNEFEIPDEYKRFSTRDEPHKMSGSLEWPDKHYGSGADFLCFDATKSIDTARQHQPNGKEDEPDFYTILHPQRLTTLETAESNERLSGSCSDSDRIDEQIDFEAEIGLTLQPPRSLTTVSKPATICRLPPVDVETVQALSTGEMLPSGIGPAPLIARNVLTSDYQDWRDIAKKAAKRFRPLQRFLNGKRQFPEPLAWDRDEAYYYKVTMHLSKKDRLRWNMACNAFRAALAEAENLADTSESRKTFDGKEATSAIEDRPKDFGGTALCTQNDKPTIEVTSDGKLEMPNNDSAADITKPSGSHGPKVQDQLKLQSLQKEVLGASGAAAFSISSFCLRSANLDFGALDRLLDSRSKKQAKSYFGIVMYCAMSVISGIYAGIHLALWNHDFPTRSESLLWKISATTLGVPALVFVIVVNGFWLVIYVACFLRMKKHLTETKFLERAFGKSFTKKLKRVLRTLGRCRKSVYRAIDNIDVSPGALLDKVDKIRGAKANASKTSKCCYWTIFVTVVVPYSTVYAAPYAACLASIVAAVVLYGFSRVYIVAESFLSLRHVPIGVY